MKLFIQVFIQHFGFKTFKLYVNLNNLYEQVNVLFQCVADCVLYYYLTKKNNNYKTLVRRNYGKRRGRNQVHIVIVIFRYYAFHFYYSEWPPTSGGDMFYVTPIRFNYYEWHQA